MGRSIVIGLSACVLLGCGGTGMREVTSVDGDVRFHIRAHWVDAQDGDIALFYDPAKGSGTLRLSVLKMQIPSGLSPMDSVKSIAKIQNAKLETLAPNRVMFQYEKRAPNGDFSPHVWQVCHFKGDRMDCAIFSYTDAEGPGAADKDCKVIEWLDREVRTAEFIER